MLDRVITNNTDSPIFKAFFSFLEVPIKGHIPKNFDRTIFCMRTLDIKILIRFIFSPLSFYVVY